MKRLIISFFITLLFYLLLFGLLFIDFRNNKTFSKRSIHRLSLANIHIQKPQIQPKITKPTSIPKPQPKSQNKKIIKKMKKRVKKYILAKHESYQTKKVALSKPIKIKKTKKRTKSITTSKRLATKQKISKSHQTAPSLATLFMSNTPKKNPLDDLPVQFRKLYKDEFNSYTKAQKEFLRSNLSLIGKITQKYLYLRGYPYIAIKTHQQGLNAVEFYLYPNGDISNLRLIKSSGYEALDTNSIETIKVAFKDYPRPKEKTKIKIYIHYELFR